MSVVTPTDGRHSFVTLSTRAAILTWCIVIAMTLSIGALMLALGIGANEALFSISLILRRPCTIPAVLRCLPMLR